MYDLSVIMTTYNDGAGFINQCVRSIQNQTFEEFEFIIVVEPGESNIDFMRQIADEDGRVKVLENTTRLGVAASRNRAIQESSGKYIAIIDGDDYCKLNRFETQINYLEKHKNISVVGSQLYLVDESGVIVGERTYPRLHRDIKKYFLFTMAIANPSVMVRKRDIEEVGLFNESFTKAEDLELWLRFLVCDKKMHNLPDYLVYYRVQVKDNLKRGRLHYKNSYIARKRYSRYIWPFHKRVLSLSFFFIISHFPNVILDNLLDSTLVKVIKNIRIDRSRNYIEKER